ncbi:MAG: CBS domain-containing protein [Methanomassiliicoccus sp.]|nr:CBS domain-containing protein [Methanomassiliicoccus sp.]
MPAEELVGVNRKERIRTEVDSMGLDTLMSEKFETFSPTDTVNDILKRMRDLDIHEVPVAAEKKRLMGVVSYGTLLKRRNLSIDAKADTVMVMPQLVTPSTPVTEVAELFINSGFREVPVQNNGSIVGMVSRSDLLRVVREIRELQRIPVGEIMSPDVKSVKLDTSARDAVKLMSILDVRVLPVVDNNGRIVGVVGIKDIANMNWYERIRQTVGEANGEKDPVDVTVGSVAVEPAVVAPPTMELGEAARIMLDRGISTLPVVEGGEMRGIVTKYDLVALIASLRQRSMMYTQISGLRDDDRFAQDMMMKEIELSMKKISPIATPMLFDLHVGMYNDEGLNYKYSLHGRLTTDDRVFTASSVDWDLIRATADLMRTFERRVIEHKELKLEHRRKTRNIGHSY